MTVLRVVKYGNSILRGRMKSIKNISDISSLVKNMFDTMYQEDGIGLAANQVGIDLNLSVIDISHTDECDTPMVFVNGRIVEKWGNSAIEEGCLSLPGIRVNVPRSERILFRYQDLSGTEHEKEFNGLLARVIQHEMDHLNGMLIIDRISPLIRQQYAKQLEELAASAHDDRRGTDAS